MCTLTLAGLTGRTLLTAFQERGHLQIQDRQPREAPPPPREDAPPTIRVDVELVNLLFNVHQKRGGELAPNLNKEDFTVFENGVQQAISRFSRDTNLPLTLGMLVDVSGSQRNLIEIERDAASSFFSNVIEKSDEAFLIAFGRDTLLLQDFTGSVPKLLDALNGLKGDTMNAGQAGQGGQRQGGGYPGSPFPPLGGGGRGRYPGGRGGGGGRSAGQGQSRFGGKGTLFFDAVYLASGEELGNKSGRKALVLITDGDDRGSYYSCSQAIEGAQRANAMIYSIYYVDQHSFAQRLSNEPKRGPVDLKRMSDETGGRVFTVDKNHTLQGIFKELQDEMRSQYSIAYNSTNRERDGEFRRVEIRPANVAFEVQARLGYYATPAHAPK